MTETTQLLMQKLISAISEYGKRDLIGCFIADWLTRRRSRGGGECTDLTLAHDLGSFKVHRLVVCNSSIFFRKACTAGFEVRQIRYD